MVLSAILDTSILIAAISTREQHHLQAADVLREFAQGELTLPITILSETMSLISSRHGVSLQREVLDRIMASGVSVLPVDTQVLARAREIDGAYADAGFGFADSTLLACCEELRVARVLSLDRRLACYRPTFAPGLEILP